MLKKILIGIATVFLVYTILCAFAPKQVTIFRTQVVKSSKASAFATIADVKNWEKWSPWNAKDPDMKITYFGDDMAKGSGYSWDGNKNVGKGKLTLTDLYPSDSLFIELDFMENGKGQSAFYFTGNDGELTVKWTMTTSEFPYFVRPMGWFFDKMMAPDFESGLAKIAEVAPTIIAEAAVDNDAPIKEPEGLAGVQEIDACNLIAFKDVADNANISAKLGAAYGEIGKVLAANKVDFVGPVAAIYYKNESNNFEFDACVPLMKEIKDPKPCHVIAMPYTKALVYNYYGSYMEMYKAYDEMKKYIKENKLTQNGSPWEQYITDPTTVKDPSEIFSKIFIPVK